MFIKLSGRADISSRVHHALRWVFQHHTKVSFTRGKTKKKRWTCSVFVSAACSIMKDEGKEHIYPKYVKYSEGNKNQMTPARRVNVWLFVTAKWLQGAPQKDFMVYGISLKFVMEYKISWPNAIISLLRWIGNPSLHIWLYMAAYSLITVTSAVRFAGISWDVFNVTGWS